MAGNDFGGSNMVLRTVYLPKDLDDQLRRLAFDQQTSKNDLIRSAVSTALEVWNRTPDDKQAVAAPHVAGRAAKAGGR